MKNETGRPPERPAANPITAADDSRVSGERPARLIRVYAPARQPKRPRVPKFVIEIPFEGRVTAVIRGAQDEADAARLRAWAETDPEMRELCRLVRRIRDRMAA